MWSCPNCGEQIDDEFDHCWTCGTAHDGTLDSDFKRERDEAALFEMPPHERSSDSAQFRILHIFYVTTLVAVIFGIAYSPPVVAIISIIIGLVFFAVFLTVFGLLFGLAVWFVVSCLLYFISLDRTNRSSARRLPFDLWMRNQRLQESSHGEDGFR